MNTREASNRRSKHAKYDRDSNRLKSQQEPSGFDQFVSFFKGLAKDETTSETYTRIKNSVNNAIKKDKEKVVQNGIILKPGHYVDLVTENYRAYSKTSGHATREVILGLCLEIAMDVSFRAVELRVNGPDITRKEFHELNEYLKRCSKLLKVGMAFLQGASGPDRSLLGGMVEKRGLTHLLGFLVHDKMEFEHNWGKHIAFGGVAAIEQYFKLFYDLKDKETSPDLKDKEVSFYRKLWNHGAAVRKHRRLYNSSLSHSVLFEMISATFLKLGRHHVTGADLKHLENIMNCIMAVICADSQEESKEAFALRLTQYKSFGDLLKNHKADTLIEGMHDVVISAFAESVKSYGGDHLSDARSADRLYKALLTFYSVNHCGFEDRDPDMILNRSAAAEWILLCAWFVQNDPELGFERYKAGSRSRDSIFVNLNARLVRCPFEVFDGETGLDGFWKDFEKAKRSSEKYDDFEKSFAHTAERGKIYEAILSHPFDHLREKIERQHNASDVNEQNQHRAPVDQIRPKPANFFTRQNFNEDVNHSYAVTKSLSKKLGTQSNTDLMIQAAVAIYDKRPLGLGFTLHRANSGWSRVVSRLFNTAELDWQPNDKDMRLWIDIGKNYAKNPENFANKNSLSKWRAHFRVAADDLAKSRRPRSNVGTSGELYAQISRSVKKNVHFANYELYGLGLMLSWTIVEQLQSGSMQISVSDRQAIWIGMIEDLTNIRLEAAPTTPELWSALSRIKARASAHRLSLSSFKHSEHFAGEDMNRLSWAMALRLESLIIRLILRELNAHGIRSRQSEIWICTSIYLTHAVAKKYISVALEAREYEYLWQALMKDQFGNAFECGNFTHLWAPQNMDLMNKVFSKKRDLYPKDIGSTEADIRTIRRAIDRVHADRPEPDSASSQQQT